MAGNIGRARAKRQSSGLETAQEACGAAVGGSLHCVAHFGAMVSQGKSSANKPRAVLFRGIADARDWCEAARATGTNLELWSFPGAASSIGPIWFEEIVRAISDEFPDVSVTAVLDCGDEPGRALAALRQGVTIVALGGKPAARRKVAAIAEQAGATVVSRPRRVLDPRRPPGVETPLADLLTGRSRR